MASIRNKQRPFRLLKYLYENTDENHPVSTPELVKIFQAEDAHASRKTVKDDIDVLIGEGFDIVTVRSTQNSFFLANRRFELPEIKLLIDAVSSSRFINREKSTARRRRSGVTFTRRTGSKRTIIRFTILWTRSLTPSMRGKRSAFNIMNTAGTRRNSCAATGRNIV